MRKLWEFIKDNKLLTALVLSSIILTIPLIFICFYGSPVLDDFVHASKIKNILPSHYGLTTYISTTVNYSFKIYRELQGAYTINLLIALNPMVYNIKLIPFFYIINFIFFIFTTYVFSNTISKRILNSDRKTALLLTSTILIVSLQFISLAESFYWYAGIVGYMLPYSLALLFLANLIMIYRSKRVFLHTCLGVILGFILGGTNFPLGLFLAITGILLSIGSYVLKNKAAHNVVAVFLSLIIGFLINIFAIGNSQRMAMGFKTISMPKTVLLSFWGFAVSFGHILSFSAIVFFLILLLPKMVKLLKDINYDFKSPLLISFLSVCAASSLYAPAFYAGIGEIIPNRYDNITVFIIIWLIFINIFYWLGWALKNDKIIIDFQKQGLTFFILAIISLQVPLSIPRLSNISFVTASREIATGVVTGYKSEVGRMYKKLSDSPDQDVVFEIKTKTLSLQNIIISKDKTFWGNKVLAKYFGAKSIRSGE